MLAPTAASATATTAELYGGKAADDILGCNLSGSFWRASELELSAICRHSNFRKAAIRLTALLRN